ncbi:glycoside hydrolase family 19 protein [Novosphingobium sp.]|uniref:glycoside hydrolase family 19 protein n=1 Tax=Novosphingobium sp. TaxID=1874826 RepID=UPI003D0D87E4
MTTISGVGAVSDIASLQRRLVAGGYDIGAVDSMPGPRTYAGLLAFVARRPMSAMIALGSGCATYLPRYGIADSAPRLANFIGQAAHETGSFRYLAEIWGPTDAQRRYDGRADLGNSQPGDGQRFKGRGIFQSTGRANYAALAAQMSLDLLGHPELLEIPSNAVWSACLFWTARNLSALADAGADDTITHRINGGENGIADRRAFVARAKGILA